MWLLILSGLIACTGKPVSSSCPVELNPSRAAVKFKDPFSANCISTSNQTESMGWESTNGGVALTERVTSLPLKINSVTDWKLDPKCYINLQDGNQCLSHLTVTVYKMPDSVSMSEPSELIEGKDYRMQCDIENVAPAKYLSVHWYKGNKIFFTETFTDSSATPVNKSSVTNVTAHGDDDGTPIWCEARLSFWPNAPSLPPIQSKSHQATVLYSPTFFNPANEEHLEFKAGTKIELNCTARGNPMPVYSWTLPHDIQRRMKNQSTNQSILTPSFELPGTYTCTVSNSQGTKTKRFTVTEPARNRTTFAALVGGFTALGVALLIAGPFFVTPEGTFSTSRGYLRGKPASSGPV